MKVALIGAGCSGFTTAKRLAEAGIDFDWFEASSVLGGNWAYGNPNGMSAAYQSLHIDTSKWRLAFEDFPVPADWPDFPSHYLLAQYFNDYVDHFGLRPRIRFNTRVLGVTRHGDAAGREANWQVTASDGTDARYRAVIVANGHHWSPNTPEYPGHFDGTILHAHDYRNPFEPVDMRGKTVIVVGLGNSAVDIASELGQRTMAGKVMVSTRRGVWVLPKYFNGKPSDKSPLPAWLPLWAKRKLGRWAIKRSIGAMEDFGLPTPDHEPLDGHPTVSSEFLLRLGSGDVTIKPAIAELCGDHVRFTDGSSEKADVLVYATGYKTSFPFLGADIAPVVNNHIG
ncbi:MAG: flavin-containing monooxygenase, partial [Polymorphobacter sp.]